MRASYTSGLIVALLEEGLHLDWVGGISAGASHTCNYLSRDAWRTRHAFTDFASDPRFGNWRTFVRGQGLFNARYIYEQSGLPDEALPFDWETFTANPAQVCIGSFDAVTGNTVYWRRPELATFEDVMVKVRASSTMPVVMPPVRVGDHVFVDGALGTSGGIPLEPARQDGFRKFLIVLTQEEGYVKGPQRHEWFYRNHFRRLPAIADALRERPAVYNRVREEVFDLRSSGDAYVFVPEHMKLSNGERNIATLRAAYAAGLDQARREMPAIREFLGV